MLKQHELSMQDIARESQWLSEKSLKNAVHVFALKAMLINATLKPIMRVAKEPNHPGQSSTFMIFYCYSLLCPVSVEACQFVKWYNLLNMMSDTRNMKNRSRN